MFSDLLCKVQGHQVNRRRVWHDSLNYRTSCHRCGTAMLRERRGWYVYDADIHDRPERQPHPRDAEDTGDAGYDSGETPLERP